MGIRVDEPAWCEIPSRKPQDYIEGINATIDPKEMLLVVVVIKRKEDKKAIKSHIDKALGIPSQFILLETINRSKGLGMYSNLLKQMNAKVRLDLYRLKIPL
jgi:hypothetical protein